MNVFYEHLGLNYQKNIYYGMFNLPSIENDDWRDLHVFDKLKAIAQSGVVLMPANLFWLLSSRLS